MGDMSANGAAPTPLLIDETAELLCATARTWEAGLRQISERREHPLGARDPDGGDVLRDLPADLLLAVAHAAEALTDALALALRYRDGR
jgi:hypothetical protein